MANQKSGIRNQKSTGLSRRRFLQSAAAFAAPLIVPASVLRAQAGRPAPSNRIALGFIGLGGQGEALLDAFLHSREVEVVGLCDVHGERRKEALALVERYRGARIRDGSYRAAKEHADFRALLARPDVDAVVIATPDHWHALIAIAAAKAGKDLYLEKPLAFSVAEGRAIVRAVERYGRVFQLGMQQRSDATFRRACELVRNGRLGKLHTIRLGVPPGHALVPQPVRSLPPESVPAGFDYDLWLGPAPAAPYSAARCQRLELGGENLPGWYFISDYSPGWIAGWGVHHVDTAQQGHGTDLTGPVEVEGRGVFPADGLFDNATHWHVEYTFADGVKMIEADTTQERMGVKFEGERGWVFVWRDGEFDASPRSLLKETIGEGEIRLYRSKDHQQNFLDCLRTRQPTAAPAEVGHRSTTICHLGNIAMRLGRKLRWDPAAEQFAGDAEANRLLGRAMRAPWRG